jgi:spermidine synthase
VAVVWEHAAGGRRYEIRKAGRSMRLYTNGVLHTQYHPGYIFGGGVWDLLGLPALWHCESRLSGILLLGLGGGAVARQLHELVEWDRFVAIERNPVHLDIARRFFGLDRIPVDLVELDAGRWMAEYGGERFDLVIDDLFSDTHSEARRSEPLSRDWYRRLSALLSERGILVINFADGRDLERRIKRIPAIRREFESVYKFTLPAYGNAVAVLLRRHRGPADLTRALGAIHPRRRRAKLRYHLERIQL